MHTEEIAALPFSVEQFLPLPGNALHHQRLWIMLFATLAAARFRHIEASDLPPSSRVSTMEFFSVRDTARECAHAARESSRIVSIRHTKGSASSEISCLTGGHAGLSPDKLILAGPDKGDILR